MNVKLPPKQLFELLSLKGGCTGSSESTLVIMPHYWKSHVAAHIYYAVSITFADELIHVGRPPANNADTESLI